MLKTLLTAIILSSLVHTLSYDNDHRIGAIIDNYCDVPVYYNGKLNNTNGRHFATDGYNFGLKWQCVEFVKRYYFVRFGHKMLDSYGHAKDYFDSKLGHNALNKSRGLLQYANTDREKPQIDDIIVFGPSYGNPFGHIAIVSSIQNGQIEIVQQNVGIKTRELFTLSEYMGIYTVANRSVLGWLRYP